jgi:RHS repeat-associated protein
VGVVSGGQVYYIEPDHLGTPRAVIDPAREVAVWTWPLTGEAFGNSAPNEDPDGDATAFVLDLRFPGQRYDAVSGLDYNYFRDYEPMTGRYLESDPIGLIASTSTFQYVDGAPLSDTDSVGLGKEARANAAKRAFADRSTKPKPGGTAFSAPGVESWFWCAKMRCCNGTYQVCPDPSYCVDIGFAGTFPSDGAVASGLVGLSGFRCKCIDLKAGPRRSSENQPELATPEDVLETLKRMRQSRWK